MPGASLSLTPLDWIICVGLLAFSIAVGLYFSAKMHASESSSNFFLAGRKLTWPIVGASLFATNIGAEHLVGLSGDSYRYGLCAATVELVTFVTLGVTCAVLLPHYMKTKVFTIPEFLELRYNRAARTFFSGLMLVISVMTKMAFCLFAGALVLNSLVGWDVMKVVWLLGLVSAIVTIIGGFAAVAYTDSIQTAIMVVGSGLGLIIGLDKVGGWSGLEAKLAAQSLTHALSIHRPYTDPNYPFWGIMMGVLYGGIFYWGMDQVNVQRLLGAPNLHQARWGAMFATLLKLTPVFIFAMPGLICLALFPNRDPRTTFVSFLNDILPSGLRGMVLASLLAALISSLLSVMNSFSTLAVRDFILRWSPGMTESVQVFVGRVMVLVGAVFGIGAAYLVYRNQEGLYKYLQSISIYLTMPLTPAIFFGVASRRVTVQGAMASFAVGFLIAGLYVTDQFVSIVQGQEAAERLLPFLHHTLTANYTYRGLWGTILIIFTLLGVSAVTPRTPAAKLVNTTMNWSTRWESFEGWKDWRLQWLILTIVTVVIYAWLW